VWSEPGKHEFALAEATKNPESNTAAIIKRRGKMAELAGESENGVALSAHSRNNHSVFSVSDTGNGVVGQSKGNPAGGNAGVFGDHLNNGTGVTGRSAGGFGVAGISQSNHAVFAHSETGIGAFSKSGQLAGRFEGDVEVTGDIRLTSADCAEDFDIANGDLVEPGTVMVGNGSDRTLRRCDWRETKMKSWLWNGFIGAQKSEVT
jgi:hypothetical protein